MKEIIYKPIGIIHSPFKQPEGTPIQASGVEDIQGTIEIYREYMGGLKDLSGFSHIILLYHFHLAKKASLTARPFLDDRPHGIFAIRGPSRPNPIGMSIVKLISIKENILVVEEIDIVDGTPLLDIKPYVHEFDCRENAKIGWIGRNISKLRGIQDDGRFSK